MLEMTRRVAATAGSFAEHRFRLESVHDLTRVHLPRGKSPCCRKPHAKLYRPGRAGGGAGLRRGKTG